MKGSYLFTQFQHIQFCVLKCSQTFPALSFFFFFWFIWHWEKAGKTKKMPYHILNVDLVFFLHTAIQKTAAITLRVLFLFWAITDFFFFPLRPAANQKKKKKDIAQKKKKKVCIAQNKKKLSKYRGSFLDTAVKKKKVNVIYIRHVFLEGAHEFTVTKTIIFPFFFVNKQPIFLSQWPFSLFVGKTCLSDCIFPELFFRLRWAD